MVLPVMGGRSVKGRLGLGGLGGAGVSGRVNQ